ncbi:MAG: fumarate reductase/succinate dehydrogenase flavoprotein subunit [Nakamurella sp.]
MADPRSEVDTPSEDTTAPVQVASDVPTDAPTPDSSVAAPAGTAIPDAPDRPEPQIGDLVEGLYRLGEPIADTKAPDGPIEQKWTTRKFEAKLVNPANRRKLKVIIVGTGLAGASAAATLGEGGYHVTSFCYQDSPRRAHSIAAQGGINAAKNYQEDGDSTYRLFYDTVKGGDYRSRETNVYRLAEVSTNIIDQCVAQGVPFARDYGGLLDNRSFGGVQVSRTFYARGQTGQQLLIGAYQALERQVAAGNVTVHTRHEMLEVVVVDGKARGVIVRDMVTGEIETHLADAVVLASGGYGNVFFLSTNAMGCNVTASWRAHRKGAHFANPCYTQIHPTCIPVSGEHQSKLTLMSESLRNDGRIWVPKNREDCEKDPREIPEDARDYYLERIYPAFGNLVPRDIASRQAKNVCDEGRGVGPKIGDFARGVYLDFTEAIERLGLAAVKSKYGNLFDMYARITGEDPYATPMRIYPAVHYTMGGLWVDYDLQSSIPGLFVTGEANFSDHGANRLGASALMQGLADGYFVLPNTIRDYLAAGPFENVESHPEVAEAKADVQGRIKRLLEINGDRTVDSFHRELGHIMWEYCGMERSEEGLRKAVDLIRGLKAEFWRNVKVLGSGEELNQALERAGRVADFIELGELMCIDALHRRESCGGHFRTESQTEEGEALRHDDEYAYVAAWEWGGDDGDPVLHKEDLVYNFIELKQRSYK